MRQDQAALWRRFLETRSIEDRNALVLANRGLARFFARRLLARMHLRPRVTADDLFSAADLGLLKAVERYTPLVGVQFSTFAAGRICGAILDALHAYDDWPRDLRSFERWRSQAADVVASVLGRKPDGDEVAARMGMNPDRFAELARRAETRRRRPLHTITQDDWTCRPTGRDPGDGDDRPPGVDANMLMSFIGRNLNPRQREIISLRYVRGQSLSEIARARRVTRQAIHEIHSTALNLLRIRFASYRQRPEL